MFDTLQQFGSCFIEFWIELSTANCSKSMGKGQGFPREKRKDFIRGSGILPYGNLFISDDRDEMEYFACVMT